MKEVEQVYYNDFGVAFHWRKEGEVLRDKVQIIFKETGFYFTATQVAKFADIIDQTCQDISCSSCCQRAHCHRFLLKTPLNQIDLAVNKAELMQIKDLIDGTLFNLNLMDYLDTIGRN
ncbi:hypothetical protein GR160_18490 [Flavobacterium sp. Sd200]|uniref:hypothetical protein n=1 Tax=Flavobacterium sp. Sd200 TaxID=2692211 RepID=UPI00137160B4|nr:hypothetical protein [Flavobacterium sp. Sd200]MXN93222.1 hypothetical protein [Flavobacterium sp. Sd200]